MAFDPARLTRLSGPLSPIFPQENQAKYWAYRPVFGDDITDIMADGYFPETSSIAPSDFLWVFLSDGGTPPFYTLIPIYVTDES